MVKDHLLTKKKKMYVHMYACVCVRAYICMHVGIYMIHKNNQIKWF